MGRTTSSLLLTRRGSFRVATTVPTIFPNNMSGSTFCVPGFAVQRWFDMNLNPRILRFRGRGLADGEHFFEAGVRPGDDVDGDELADPARRGSARVGGRLDRGDVAANHRGHVAGADLLPPDER